MVKSWIFLSVVLLFSHISFADTIFKNESDVQITFNSGSADIVLEPRTQITLKGDNVEKSISFSLLDKDAHWRRSEYDCPKTETKLGKTLTIIARKSKLPKVLVKTTKSANLTLGVQREFKCEVK